MAITNSRKQACERLNLRLLLALSLACRGKPMLTYDRWAGLEPLIEACRPHAKMPPRHLQRAMAAIMDRASERYGKPTLRRLLATYGAVLNGVRKAQGAG